jgi:two-component system sensor histidine kinase KdpD
MDTDVILARRPQVVLIDELAHTNVPGGRHTKRWEDVDEVLDAGIDVISTLNIQHLESLNDVVERVTGVVQRETIPDEIVRGADQIELVDMTPEALRRRMAHGNIYAPEKVDAALGHYFRVGNLGALRELALLWMADRVDDELSAYRDRYGISEPWETKERIVVALTAAPGSEQLLRRAARMAARTHGELIGLHVRLADGGASEYRMTDRLERLRTLLGELGGRYAEVSGADVAVALSAFARAENATQIILGASRRPRLKELLRGSVINRVIAGAGRIDVHVIASHQGDETPMPTAPRRGHLVRFPPRRRLAGWLLAALAVPALTAGLTPFRDSLGLPGVLLVLLLGVVGVTLVGGAGPALLAAAAAALLADFYFTPDYNSFHMRHLTDAVALGAFVAVAAVVSVLVDRLARRGLQMARAQAEAEALARLAGDVVPSSSEALPDLVGDLRRTFDLDAVAVLRPEGGGWTTVAAAGGPVPARPQDAAFSAQLAEGTVLVLAGATVNADDTRLLSAFVAQLRLAQERTALADRAASAGELEDANKLRTAILSAVSHDLRTPLAAIKAAATSVLSNDVDWSAEQVVDFARTIDAQADRLTGLVSNLLDMSRLQAGALRPAVGPADIEDLLYETVDGLGPASAGVVVDVAPCLPAALADAGLLERALANVLSNALAWSPPGIAVRLEAAAPGEDVLIRVVDQGPGIPPEGRHRLFQPFQRLGDGAGASPNGVGLGLAVASGFTSAMGGELAVEDTPGGGATFVFHLQKAAPA